MSKTWALIAVAALLVGCVDYSIRECADACKQGGRSMLYYSATAGCQCGVNVPDAKVTP